MGDSTTDRTLKQIRLLHPQVADTLENWNNSNTVIPPNILAVATDAAVVKLGIGKTWRETPNHNHEDQYSPRVHSHYFGYEEKWFTACPRLWLKKDVDNHPELVPLDGRSLTEEESYYLSQVYAEPLNFSPEATSNDGGSYTILSNSQLAENQAFNVFGPEITINNFNDETSQWLTGSSGPNADVYVEIDFAGVVSYTLHSYSMIPRLYSQLTPGADSANPKTWALSVYVAATDEWIDAHVVTDAPEWEPFEQRQYYLDTPVEGVTKIRLRITGWYASYVDGSNVVCLRRLFLYGVREDRFVLPKLVSPDSNFIYVIPRQDLGIGMKHEEIGDVGYSVTTEPLVPANRVVLDGRSLSITDQPYLYGVCGRKYDPVVAPHSGGSFTTEFTGAEYGDATITNEFLTDQLLTSLLFSSSSGVYPKNFTLAVWDGTSQIPILDVVDNTADSSQYFDIPEYVSASNKAFILKITEWTSNESIGTLAFTFRATTDRSTYVVPDMRDTAPDGLVPYVVTQVRTEDNHSSVVLELQAAMLAMQQQLAEVTSRLIQVELG